MTLLLSGFTLIAIAIAIILSAFVRLVQSGQLREQVKHGQTGVRELAELSGITDPRDLQDAFGPPGMDRIWHHVSLPVIAEKRTLKGLLMSEPRLHLACIAIAVIALVLPHWSMQLLLVAAAISQSGAWLSAAQLPK